MPDSSIPRFFEKSRKERLDSVGNFADLTTEELEILQLLYQRIVITDIVRSEIHADLPEWIEVSTEYDQKQLQILELELDKGEASAIALALENPESRIILDESKGRSVAKRLGLKVTGTLGIIIKAKDDGLIDSGKRILEKLQKKV